MVKLELGQALATPGALDALEKSKEAAMTYFLGHAQGDWGIVNKLDWRPNDRALEDGSRLLSAYLLPTGVKIWIIPEADRSLTTVLLPDEY